jgi:hypothetical protein
LFSLIGQRQVISSILIVKNMPHPKCGFCCHILKTQKYYLCNEVNGQSNIGGIPNLLFPGKVPCNNKNLS